MTRARAGQAVVERPVAAVSRTVAERIRGGRVTVERRPSIREVMRHVGSSELARRFG